MSQRPNESVGLYCLGRSLLIDPSLAQFPYRCIFTNEEVDELSFVKLSEIEAVGVGPVRKVLRRDVELHIPLSDTWRIRKLKFWLLVASLLKITAVMLVLGAALYVFGFVDEQKQMIEILIPSIMVGGVLFLSAGTSQRLKIPLM